MFKTRSAGSKESGGQGESPGQRSSWPTNLLVLLAVSVFVLSGCSLNGASVTPPVTRAATQTPWIIYVPVTTTAEPATVTPLPTVTVARVPSRTSTRPPATKAAAQPTKPPATPVAALPPPTAAPACSAGAVTLSFPENGAPRGTKKNGPGPDVFDFQWQPFQSGESDPQMGYRLTIDAKAVGTNRTINGDTRYISHNGFLKNGRHYIYDSRAVHGLVGAGDANAAVFWNVTVVKTTGSFDDQGNVSGTVVACGPASQTWTISLIVNE